MLHEISRLQREGSVDILGAGSLVCDENGKFSTRQANPDISTGTTIGLLAGMFVGLLGGPVFWLGGSALGAVSGGLVEHFTRLGFTQSQLDAVKAGMTRGSSAVFALVHDNRIEAFEQELARLAAVSVERLLKVGLRSEVARQLAQARQQSQPKQEVQPNQEKEVVSR